MCSPEEDVAILQIIVDPGTKVAHVGEVQHHVRQFGRIAAANQRSPAGCMRENTLSARPWPRSTETITTTGKATGLCTTTEAAGCNVWA